LIPSTAGQAHAPRETSQLWASFALGIAARGPPPRPQSYIMLPPPPHASEPPPACASPLVAFSNRYLMSMHSCSCKTYPRSSSPPSRRLWPRMPPRLGELIASPVNSPFPVITSTVRCSDVLAVVHGWFSVDLAASCLTASRRRPRHAAGSGRATWWWPHTARPSSMGRCKVAPLGWLLGHNLCAVFATGWFQGPDE
jgi:hypothetical protein